MIRELLEAITLLKCSTAVSFWCIMLKCPQRGFGTAYSFLKQIVTNSASEFVFIHIQTGSQHSPFFFSSTATHKEDPNLCFHSDHTFIKRVPLIYCSVPSCHPLPEDWIKGVVLYWCTACCQVFNLAAAVEGLISYPPGPVALAYSLLSLSWQQRQLHRSPCRPHMSHNCLSAAHVFQARHNVCYQQDIVSLYDSSFLSF